jgi:hypothetical protein
MIRQMTVTMVRVNSDGTVAPASADDLTLVIGKDRGQWEELYAPLVFVADTSWAAPFRWYWDLFPIPAQSVPPANPSALKQQMDQFEKMLRPPGILTQQDSRR